MAARADFKGVRTSCIRITDVCNLIRTQASLRVFKKDSSLHFGTLFKKGKKKRKKKKENVDMPKGNLLPLLSRSPCAVPSHSPLTNATPGTPPPPPPKVQFWCVSWAARACAQRSSAAARNPVRICFSISSAGTPSFGKGKKKRGVLCVHRGTNARRHRDQEGTTAKEIDTDTHTEREENLPDHSHRVVFSFFLELGSRFPPPRMR